MAPASSACRTACQLEIAPKQADTCDAGDAGKTPAAPAAAA
jgi:hypothetical protein